MSSTRPAKAIVPALLTVLAIGIAVCIGVSATRKSAPVAEVRIGYFANLSHAIRGR